MSIIRCGTCKENIIEETKYMDWLSIMNFFEFLYNEGYIEEITYQKMIDRLMTFKKYATDEKI